MNKVSRVGGVASPEVLKVLEWFKSQLVGGPISESGYDELGWYVKFNTGLILQGGRVAAAKEHNQVISFNLPFETLNYFAIAIPEAETSAEGQACELAIFSKTPVSFTSRLINVGAGNNPPPSTPWLVWCACGH